MVKINKSTWIIPTSYGLVFSHIDKQNKLQRIYLDNEATLSLIKNKSQEVINLIEKKNIPIKYLKQHHTDIKKEKKQCDKHIQDNHWKLFSLYPLQISIQTVNYCNAKCDFCYANTSQSENKKNMDVKTIYSLKDYAADHGIKFGLSGGEPLLHPKIYDILKYKNEEVYDTLITNLTVNLDKSNLIDTKVDLIQVSIHGHGIIHDKIIRIKNAYETVYNNMNKLIKNMNIATNTVITPLNIESIEKMINDLSDFQKKHDKKLSYVRFVPVLPSGAGAGISIYKTKNNFISKVKKMLIKMMENHKDLNFEIPMLMSNPYEYFYHDGKWFCPAGSTVSVVRIDGHLIPCNQFLNTKIASHDTTNTSDINSIWLNDPLLSSMRKGITIESNNIACNECRYLIMK